MRLFIIKLKTLTAFVLTGLAGGAFASYNTLETSLTISPQAKAILGPSAQVQMTCGNKQSLRKVVLLAPTQIVLAILIKRVQLSWRVHIT